MAGGVTIASLQPMRPIPFRILYILGLDSELFPGSNALESLDLRGVQREPGDVRPAEAKTYLLLENLIAAQEKLYLLYNNHDLSKDRRQLPAVPLTQLCQYLSEHVTQEPFRTVEVPRGNGADWLFDPGKKPDYQDVLVQYRDADRLVAISAAQREGRLTLDSAQQKELKKKTDALTAEFAIAPASAAALPLSVTVPIKELRRFLEFPAYASLRRHLRIDDDEEPESEAAEPLVTPDGEARRIERLILHRLVRRAAAGDLQQALDEWPDHFRAVFEEGRLRCRVPEDAFGDIDRDDLFAQLDARIKGDFERFLRARTEMVWCGPVLIGESYTPVGAKTRFPALRFRPGAELPKNAGPEIRIVGSTPMAWLERDRFEILAITTADIKDSELSKYMLEPLLVYLTLLASPDPNAKGISGRKMLSARHFELHIAHAGGIRTWQYPTGLISPDEAVSYLAQLARDLLDPGQLDFLPFWLVTGTIDLKRIYDETLNSSLSPDGYVERLEDAQEFLVEKDYLNQLEVPQVVEMSGARIPADALAKVRRRFGPLDRGPRLVRQSESW
jgi:hypothetical protein